MNECITWWKKLKNKEVKRCETLIEEMKIIILNWNLKRKVTFCWVVCIF